VHASAALYHHLFRRDATLARMLPTRWTQRAASPPRPAEPPADVR
jgi:cytochrome b561